MHHYTQGKTTKQAHKGIPEGLFEEEQGLLGFFGPVSHLLRSKPSTRWTKIEGELKPRMYDLVKFPEVSGRKRLFHNAQLNVYWQWALPQTEKNLQAFRCADGDLLYFCHKGHGEVWTEYGVLDYREGHYVVIPKCVAHLFMAKEKTNLLVVENKTSHFIEPERGMVGRHAVYDINAIGKPDLDLLHKRKLESGAQVLDIQVQHRAQLTNFSYDECAFDVVGWKGDLFPISLHVDNMMPLMSHRAHLPPSAHTTFVARDFVVCTFLPRPLEHDADALKVPFYHQNIDYDEILFYHAGDFFSRDNLHAGMLSFHPAGFPHGPHPKAMQNIGNKTETNEYAVMIDTRWPLERDAVLDEVELTEYWKSWQKK